MGIIIVIYGVQARPLSSPVILPPVVIDSEAPVKPMPANQAAWTRVYYMGVIWGSGLSCHVLLGNDSVQVDIHFISTLSRICTPTVLPFEPAGLGRQG